MVRYSFDALLTKAISAGSGVGVDGNGDPIDPVVDPTANPSIPFKCDYQPTVRTPLFDSSGSFVRVSFILFVSTSGMPEGVKLANGDNVECNGVKGIIVSIFPTNTNIKVWVK